MVIVTLQEGRRAIPLDIRFDKDCPGMNLLTNEGFATALYHCSTMAPGSSATLAPVCSTFVAVFPSKIQYPKWNFSQKQNLCVLFGAFFSTVSPPTAQGVAEAPFVHVRIQKADLTQRQSTKGTCWRAEP